MNRTSQPHFLRVCVCVCALCSVLSLVYVQSVCDVASQADLSLYKPSTRIGLKAALASRLAHSLDSGGVQVSVT